MCHERVSVVPIVILHQINIEQSFIISFHIYQIRLEARNVFTNQETNLPTYLKQNLRYKLKHYRLDKLTRNWDIRQINYTT